MRVCRSLTAALVAASLVAWLPACRKKEGPAERAGKVVDQALEKAGTQVEKVGDAIKDAARE